MSMIDIKASRNSSKKKSELLEMMLGDKMKMKFTMTMPVTLHNEFKAIASLKGMPMSEIVNSILFNYIQKEINK